MKESRVGLDKSKTILYCEGYEALAQVAQSNCGCPIPRSALGQTGWGSEQLGLVEGIPPCQEVWNEVVFKVPFQLMAFCDSMISASEKLLRNVF